MSQEYKSEAHGMNNHEVDEGVNKWPSIIVTFLVFKFLVHHQIFQFFILHYIYYKSLNA